MSDNLNTFVTPSEKIARASQLQQESTFQRQQDLDRYYVPLNDIESEAIRNYIATSENQEEAENNSYRAAAAIKYSRWLDIPVEDAFNNIDALNSQYISGAEFNTPKSNFIAITDNFEIGMLQNKRNDIGKKLMDAEHYGYGTSKELRAELQELDNQIAALTDQQVRSLPITALKDAAMSAPFTAKGIAAQTLGSILLGPIGGVVAGTLTSYDAMVGQEYLDLVEDGHDVSTSRNVAMASAFFQAMVESADGLQPAYAATFGMGKAADTGLKAMYNDITKSLFQKVYNSGTLGKIAGVLGKEAGGYLLSAVGEGKEEVLQGGINAIAKSLATAIDEYAVSHNLKDAKGAAWDKFKSLEVATEAVENFKGGFLGALVLGAPNMYFDGKATIADFETVGQKAESIDSKEAFKKETAESPIFDGMTAEAKAEAQEEIWNNYEPQRNKRTEQERMAAEDRAIVIDTSDNVEETVEDEAGQIVREEEYRNEDGSLNYTASVIDTNEDGSTENQFIVNGKGNTEYGRILYNEDADGNITINAFEMSAVRENLRNEVFTDFAEKFAGRNIEWETRGTTDANLKEELIRNNVRGSNNGLNYFADVNEVQNQKTRMSWDKQIKEAIPSMTSDQRSTGIALVESFANKHGMSLADYDMNIFNGKLFINQASREVYETALQQGMDTDKIGGYVDLNELGKSTKGIIYAAQKGDATTFVHENAHIFRRLLTDEEMAQAEKLFNVKDHKWTRQNEEDFAYTLQGYAFENKAVGEAKPLFEKLAQALVRVYNSLKGKIDFNPELSEFMESLFSDPQSALAQAQRAVEQNERVAQNQSVSNSEQLNNNEQTINDSTNFTSDRVEAAVDEARNDTVDNLFYQLIGEKGAQALDDAEEKTYRMDNLKVAIDMTSAGKDARAIRLATGWEKGVDGKWRYEIDDSNINVNIMTSYTKKNPRYNELYEKYYNQMFNNGEPLTDAEIKELDKLSDDYNDEYTWRTEGLNDPGYHLTLEDIMDNQELFTAYPELKSIEIVNSPIRNADRTNGVYKSFENKIVMYVNPDAIDEYKSVLLHEIQHAIQTIEGFAVGMSPEAARTYVSVAVQNKYPGTYGNKWNYEHYLKASQKARYIINLRKFMENPETFKKTSMYQEYGSAFGLPKDKQLRKDALYEAIAKWAQATKESLFDDEVSYAEYDQLDDERLKKEEKKNNNEANKYKEKAWSYDRAVEEIRKYQNYSDYELYKAFAGEVESRNVQARMYLTPEERLYTALRETEDVAREDQIVLYDGGEANSILFQEIDDVRKQYEGTDKWLKAPNGENTNLTEKQWLQVRTDNFKKWFGDWESDPQNASKMIDENGEPKVYYRGDDFINDNEGVSGLFVTENKGFAEGYGNTINEFFINSKKPFIGMNDGESLRQFVNDNFDDLQEEYSYFFDEDDGYETVEDIMSALNDGWWIAYEESGIIQAEIKRRGYDTIYITEDGADNWWIDNPNQIKSATDNNGDFSADNPSILYQFIDVAGAMNLTDRVKSLYDRAEEMRDNGADKETIRKLTGYSEGPDGVFQYELDDSPNDIIDRDGMQKAISAAAYMNRAMSNPAVTAQNLEKLQYAMNKQLELLNSTKDTVSKIYKAGELYTAKPELKNIRVGYLYDPRRIRAVQFEGGIGINLAYVQNLEDLKGALVHELQHIIDLKVDTSKYAGDFWADLSYAMEAVERNTKEYYADLVDDGGIVQYFLTDPYERNAHAAQRRMNLTAAQRRAYRLGDVINNNVLFQYMQEELDAETLKEASDFATWQEWYEYAKAMDTDGILSGAWDDVSEQTWFKSAWESAHKIFDAEPVADPEVQADKDKEFTELINKPGYLDDFLDRAKQYLNMQLDQPMDAEEEAEFNRINEMQGFMSNVMADPTHFAELDDTKRKKLLTMIENSPREYRRIYAELFNDKSLSVPEGMEYTVDTSIAPEEMQLELDRMTPAQRKEAVQKIEDEQIRQQIESGNIPMDNTLDKYIKVVDAENKKLQKEIERLKSEYTEDLARIGNAQKKAFIEEYNRLQEMAETIERRNLNESSTVKKGKAAGATATRNVTEVGENGQYNDIMRRMSELKALLAGERDAAKIIAKADERGKQKQLQRKRQAEAQALKEIKRMRTNVVKRMVRKVSFTNVNYDEARKIIAVQNFLNHWIKNGVNLWLGETEVTAAELYSQYSTDSDFREEVNKTLTSKKAGDKGRRVLSYLEEAMYDDEGRSFEQWTPQMKNALVEVLGANDQVVRLNLDKLAEQRKSAIHNFIAPNGTVTEENMRYVYEALPKDVIARIRYTPMNKWTLDQAEELARYIDTIYEDGKKIYAGKQQLRRDRYEELRRQIQEAVKETGIKINPEDTPEEVAKKKAKIEKILGLRTQAKGTAAASAEKRSMREKFMAADRGTGNVRRFARVMDNWTEGVFTDTLCFQEYMAYDEEQKAIRERTKHVQDYMAEHGITVEQLQEKHNYPGLFDGTDKTYTTDELLYIYIANMDENSKAAVMYGNFTTAEEKESVKQHEQKYADKEAIRWYMSNAEARFNRVLLDAEEIVRTNKDLAGLVQVIENDYEKQYERLNRTSIEVFNTPVNRVEAYVPLYRLESSGETNEQQVMHDILADTTGAPSEYVGRGMTKNRIQISPLNQKPVQLGLFSTWADSMEKTEHFIAYGGLVKDLNAIYTSQAAAATREAIATRYGQDANNYIKEYINELANPNKGQPKSALDTVVHVLRGQTAPAYLAWKTSGIIKQLCTSPWPFMAYVSPAEYLVSVGKFVGNWQEMNDFVKSRSVFMANRTIDPIMDLIKEAQTKADNPTKAALANFNKLGMQGLEWADWVSVAPGWYAAFQKKTAELENANKNMDPLADGYKDSEQIEQEAVAYADDVVRLTQPSGRKADLAPLFKNSSEIAKILLQFQTSLNVIYQNIRFDLPYQIKNGQFKQAAGAIIGYTAAGILVNAVVGGLFTGDGADDDPEERMKRAVFYATTQFTDSVPVVGQQLTNATQKLLTGEGYYSNSTLFPVVDTLTKTIADISKDNYGKAATDFGEGVAYTLGLPVSGSKEVLRLLGIGDNEEGIEIKPGALWGRR